MDLQQYCFRVAYMFIKLDGILRKWRKRQSKIEAILLQYSMLYGILYIYYLYHIQN